ncbi:ExbD/TolR family protein [Thalassovita taeanensis]|uniref:Biopolymer transport protein ExbD n=1 Tax=Thalassovita taeanensis TaxID=657014 RepID=A0A1H8Z9P3_9RHOB|nr:biopolymer transporter ExbD [Thalassovita taeanensis]SEP61154.1 biopolymer transport protein ExbD [Thalassovita taeanensis]
MSQFTLPVPKRRKPSLTPMIDVVFLLLVFFMLASRFGADQVLPLPLGGGGSYAGQPRLVDILPDGFRLNGVACDATVLVAQLQGLLTDPSQTIVLRADDRIDTQRVVNVSRILRRAGFTSLVLME